MESEAVYDLYGTSNGCEACDFRTKAEVCPICGNPTAEFTWSVKRMERVEAKRRKAGEKPNGY